MLTRKGNLICKALIFTFAVITAMTLDSCCDDCLGGSKGNKSSIVTNKMNKNITDKNSIDVYFNKVKTEDGQKIGASFRRRRGNERLWFFSHPLFFSAKSGDLYLENEKFDENFLVKENSTMLGYILNRYLEGFNKEFDNIGERIKIDGITEEIPYKVILVGDARVGKTQICNMEIGNSFNDNYIETVEADCFNKTFNINRNFLLKIWDIFGQEKYRSLIKLYFKETNIIILVFDVTSEDSFKNLDKLYNDVINEGAPEGAAIFVVGNKYDLLTEEVKKGNEKIIEITNKVKGWIKGN